MSRMQRFHHRHALRYTNRRRCAMEQFEPRIALSADAGDGVVHVFRSGGWVTIEADTFAYFDSFDGSVQSGDSVEPAAAPAEDFTPPRAAPADNWGVEVPGEDFSQAGTPPVPSIQTPGDDWPSSPGSPTAIDSDLIDSGLGEFGTEDLSLGAPSAESKSHLNRYPGGVGDNAVDGLFGQSDYQPSSNLLDEPLREFSRRSIARGTAPDLEGGERIVLKAVRSSEDPIGPQPGAVFSTSQATEDLAEQASAASAAVARAEENESAAGSDEALERPRARALFFEVAIRRAGDRATADGSQQAASPDAAASNDWLIRQQAAQAAMSSAASVAAVSPGGQAAHLAATAMVGGQASLGGIEGVAQRQAGRSSQAVEGSSSPQSDRQATQSLDAAFESWDRDRTAVAAPFYWSGDANQQAGLAMAVAALVAVEHTLGLRYATADRNSYPRPERQMPERKPR